MCRSIFLRKQILLKAKTYDSRLLSNKKKNETAKVSQSLAC
jgi:hypothetical protein